MIKSIIYTSNTGFTKKYAEMLGEEIHIPVYELKDAKGKVNKEDEVIYMGWLMAGVIKKLNKAQKKYNVVCVCSVGMGMPSEKQYNEIIKRNKLNVKLFYLQGGFDKTKLKGIYKFMMDRLEKIVKSKLEAKSNKTAEELEMLEMMKSGKDCVRKDNLNEVINFVK